MTDREAYNLRDFLANQVKGIGDVAFVCVTSYKCVDGTVMTFDKPTHVLIATTRQAALYEYEAKAAEEHVKTLRRKGKCFVCDGTALQGESPSYPAWHPWKPYCLDHETKYGREWVMCWEGDCGNWAKVLPQMRNQVAILAYCDEHGGQTYHPRTEEASTR
jgi:hypothetical protein